MAAMLRAQLDVCSAGRRSGCGWSGTPLLLGGCRLSSPGGSWQRGLAAPLWAVHFRTFPVEMPVVVCTRSKCQAGKRNGKETTSWYVDLTALSHSLDRDLPASSFCSQHLISFAPISSGHVLPLAVGDVVHLICVWWSSRWNHRILHCGLCFSVLCLETRACTQAT